jgi:hypothetical protein
VLVYNSIFGAFTTYCNIPGEVITLQTTNIVLPVELVLGKSAAVAIFARVAKLTFLTTVVLNVPTVSVTASG